MRSARLAVVLMLGIGLALALGNCWTAIARSTIPHALNGPITNTETRFEKHKGKDDVHLIWVGESCFQVDKAVFSHIQEGSTIEKQPFSRTMQVDQNTVELTFSNDSKGMLPAMSLVLVVLVATGWYAGRLIHEVTVEPSGAQ